MRRLLALLTSISTVLVLAAASVSAAPIVVSGMPPGWASIHHDCGNKAAGGASGGFTAPQLGPGLTTGTSEGSVKIHAGISDMEGFDKSYPTFGYLSEIGASVYEEAGSHFAFRITVDTGAGLRSLVWQPDPADGTFTPVSPLLNSTPWNVYSDQSTGDTFGTTTIEAYQDLYGDKPFRFGVISWGCSSASTVYVDTLRFVLADDESFHQEVFYDFEAEPTALSIDATPNTITYGQQVVVSSTATVIEGGQTIDNTELQLWAKPSGGVFTNIGTHATDGSGQASSPESPSVTTTYEWRFPGGGTLGSCDSPNLKVGVRAKVTASLVDSTVRQGDRLKAKGRVTPDKGGVTATLWRKTSSGNIKLGQATVQGDGTYRVVSSQISTSASAAWKLFVKVPAEGGNLPGQSPLMNAEIN